jgi:di/tricarboxylate transporter
LAEGPAWDTLTWFAALIAMAGYLNTYGIVNWFSDQVVQVMGIASLEQIHYWSYYGSFIFE